MVTQVVYGKIRVVLGVVVCLLLCIMVGRVKKGATVIGASCCGSLSA